MRSIKKIHSAEYRPIADLITYSPLPTRNLDQIDPFLFLNHHGPQKYGPDNNGLPFGPHPHRGMETVTFILEGDIAHQDSGGSKSVINAGGVQWMTAGSGLIHAEVSSDKFLKEGGNMEIMQLWLNLPAELKMTKPKYRGLQKEDIPTVELDNGKVRVDLVSGRMEGQKGAFDTLVDVFLSTINFRPGGSIKLSVPKENNIFFYVIRGNVEVNGKSVENLHLAEFENDDDSVEIKSSGESLVLFGHAEPFNEPVVARGPFVMNTEQQIQEAYEDFRNGKMGSWE